MKTNGYLETTYVDNRVFDNSDVKKLKALGFILVPCKYVSENLNEYKVYVEGK